MEDEIQRRNRRILSIVIVFFWSSEYCHVPYFTPYLSSFGLSATVIGFIVGSYGFTQMLVRIPLGIATDRTGQYKMVVLGGTFFTTLSSTGLYFSSTAFWFFVYRVCAGIAASSWIAFTVMYSGYFSREESMKAMAKANGLNNTGKLLAFGIGTLTASALGYGAPLLASCITGAIAFVLALTLKPVKTKRTPLSVPALLGTVKNPSLLYASFLGAVVMFLVHGTVFSFTSQVAKSVGASTMELGINSSLFTIVQILSAGFVGSERVRKIEKNKLYTIGFMLFAVYCLLIGYASNVYVIYAAQIVGGFTNALVFSSLLAGCIQDVPPERKSTAMGIFQALYGVGMTLGPVVMGWLVPVSYSRGYTVFAMVAGMAAVLSLVKAAKYRAKR